MKIVLVCRAYPTHRRGGMPFVCQDRARALAKAGHKVHVLSTGKPETLNDQGVEVFHSNCKPNAYTREFAGSALNHCKKWLPDIVHFDSYSHDYQWHKDLSCVTACTMHGFGVGAFLTQWNLFRLGEGPVPKLDIYRLRTEARDLQSFKTVIGVSKHEHWMLSDVYGLSNAKLVYNPIAECFFTRPTVDCPQQRTFLCAALGGQATRRFRTAFKAACLAGVSIIKVSNKPRGQMPRIYDSVTGYVLPTAYSQGYDLTVAEALSRRRFVIASATGSYLRESETNSCIATVPLGDTNALVKAMTGFVPVVPEGAAQQHHPKNHVRNWLEAIE